VLAAQLLFFSFGKGGAGEPARWCLLALYVAEDGEREGLKMD